MNDSPFKVTASGAYDLPNDLYHGDCCDGPSLSSSSIKALLISPALYWRTSPLNPKAQDQEVNNNFDLGRAAHLMLLEPEKVKREIVVIPESSLASNGAVSTKAAKAIIDAAREAGKVPLKPSEWKQINDMRSAMERHPFAIRALQHGRSEQSLFTKHNGSGVWLKARPDFLPHKSGQYIVDLKTCADLDMWEKQALVNFRYDVSAALYMRVVSEVLGIRAKGFLCLVQEKSEPYRVAMLALTIDNDTSNLILKRAEIDIARGLEVFAECWETKRWPDPYDTPREIRAPGWVMNQIENQLERESNGQPFTV